jgi:nucleotide-binding universal stress UspA family protein
MISLVVGHSRAPASQQALRVARDLAGRLNARLYIVHAITLGDYPVDPDAADWDQRAEEALAGQHEQVHAALAGCPQPWTYSVARRDPVSLISAVAEENNALMIIVGTRGPGVGATIERWCAGSVSHGLLRRQHRPVVIVRASRSPLRGSPRGRDRTQISHEASPLCHDEGNATARRRHRYAMPLGDVTPVRLVRGR